MSASAMTIDVVIVTYNSAPEIVPCLASLAPAGVDPARIVVVDNASQDDTVSLIRTGFPAVTVIENPANVYYAAACNRGIHAGQGDLVLLLNPDTLLPVGAVDGLCRILDEHSDADRSRRTTATFRS
jgi:N-acetylglucosaminyl-diphospho-decaprenol L-rhamnosyltransferase